MGRRYFTQDDYDLEDAAFDLGARYDRQRKQMYIDGAVDPLAFLHVFPDRIVPPLEHEAVLKREDNVVWLRPDIEDEDEDEDDEGEEVMAKKDTYLSCPYAEKNECKALGARWDAVRKKWYVPAGQDLTPFTRWLAD